MPKNNVDWVLMNPQIKETVIRLTEKAFDGIELTEDVVKETTVKTTQRGAISNAPAMLSAIGVMVDSLTRYLHQSVKEFVSAGHPEPVIRFSPKTNSIAINDVCLGICNEQADRYIGSFAADNPDFKKYLLFNVDTEVLYALGG